MSSDKTAPSPPFPFCKIVLRAPGVLEPVPFCKVLILREAGVLELKLIPVSSDKTAPSPPVPFCKVLILREAGVLELKLRVPVSSDKTAPSPPFPFCKIVLRAPGVLEPVPFCKVLILREAGILELKLVPLSSEIFINPNLRLSSPFPVKKK